MAVFTDGKTFYDVLSDRYGHFEGDDVVWEDAQARPAIDVTNPPHYKRFPVEVIEITEQLDYNRGNAVKYLCRAGYKEGVDELEDLSKAQWYINRAIEKLSRERGDIR